jgi:hypothetical protein
MVRGDTYKDLGFLVFVFNGLHCVQANMARSDDILTDVPGTVYLVDGRYS